jgi:hypothetical protein
MALPTAPLTGELAINRAASRIGGSMSDSGLCLQFTRQCYEVPSYYASAIDAWNAASERYEDRNPPPSASVWFWSQSIYRHVAFHLGDGWYVTTFNADIRQLDLGSMEASFGPLMGWAPELNEHSLRPPTTPPPEPPPEEDDMPWFIRRKDGYIVIVGPTGVRGITFEQWEVYGNLGYATFKPGFDNMDPGPFDVVIASLGGIVG